MRHTCRPKPPPDLMMLVGGREKCGLTAKKPHFSTAADTGKKTRTFTLPALRLKREEQGEAVYRVEWGA